MDETMKNKCNKYVAGIIKTTNLKCKEKYAIFQLKVNSSSNFFSKCTIFIT